MAQLVKKTSGYSTDLGKGCRRESGKWLMSATAIVPLQSIRYAAVSAGHRLTVGLEAETGLAKL